MLTERASVEPRTDGKSHSFRVLVVEQDGEMLALLGHVLREAGFTVQEAQEETQALVMLKARSAEQGAGRPLDAVVADGATLGGGGLRLVAGLRCSPAILLIASLWSGSGRELGQELFPQRGVHRRSAGRAKVLGEVVRLRRRPDHAGDRGVRQVLPPVAGCRKRRSRHMLTVDAPLLGCRERDVRNRFQLPAGLSVCSLVPAGHGSLIDDGRDSGLSAYFARLIDASLSWKDLGWLRSRTRLPILLKGLVRADDARRAIEAGVAALVVSNHGGRQLDTSPATIAVLPDIVAAVGGRLPVLLDGGVRRGTDVIKALALGAHAVMVGRPIPWGLAVAGEPGAIAVVILRRELDLAMTLCGFPDLASIGRDVLQPHHDVAAM